MHWRNFIFALACLAVAGGISSRLLKGHPIPKPRLHTPQSYSAPAFTNIGFQLDRAFQTHWNAAGIDPAPPASALTLARRLSLGLTGTIPSLQEIRALQSQPPETQIQWWLSLLFEDPRYSDYMAERFARAFVGVEGGPFLVYRRRRLVNWLSEAFQQNQPYNKLTQSLIASQGIWTSNPEVNFITVSIDQNSDKKGPDEAKLAGRVTRAFLGVRLDCVQCHDDKFGDRWKQSHFHELAAFFGPAKMSLSGLREGEDPYTFRYHGQDNEETVPPTVPFAPECRPSEGNLREQLAHWITHPANAAFARTTVNRIWALLFNQPLVQPIDEIPLQGPYPPGLELLARDFTEHGYDLQRLIRIIASSQVFRLASRAKAGDAALTPEHYRSFAAFPLTRLRPEQVAGSLLQAASVKTIGAESHFILQLARTIQEGKFIKRYGDIGEDEFAARGGTIPQRLLLMNGELIRDRTKENLFLNAAHRILAVAPDHATAIRTLYLATLTRLPTPDEENHFTENLDNAGKKERIDEMQDLQWALLNATEFSWNH